MLVSYNICNDGAQQDCLYIEQGHLMTPTTFMTHSMAIDPRKSVVVSWTPVRLSSMLQPGSLPLCPPGITFIYFFLKACSYIFNAIYHQTKGRVATAMPGSGQQEHCTDTGEEGHTEVCEQIQGNFSEQNGRRPEQSPGTILLPRRGQNICLPSVGNASKTYRRVLLFKKMQKDCKAEGIELPKNIMAKDPIAHVLTPQEYLRNVEAGTMPPMNNHNMLKEMAEKVTANDQTKFVMMEFRDFKRPSPPNNTRTTKMQVTHVALQTDSCDTLYVTKNTLTAYTIAVVQNSQSAAV